MLNCSWLPVVLTPDLLPHPRSLPSLPVLTSAASLSTLLLTLCKPAPLAFLQFFQGILMFLPPGRYTCCPSFYLFIHPLAFYLNPTFVRKPTVTFQTICFSLYFALIKSHFLSRSVYFRMWLTQEGKLHNRRTMSFSRIVAVRPSTVPSTINICDQIKNNWKCIHRWTPFLKG